MSQPHPIAREEVAIFPGPSQSALFLRSPVPILLVDARSGRISDCNDACSSLLGYSRSEITGMLLEGLTDEPKGRVAEHLLLALACRDDGPRRRVLFARDGSECPLEIRAAPAQEEQGTLVALYLTDVRTRQEAERDRSRLQSQLWMAQKHDAIGRLATGIANDFNNILATVMLTAESLGRRVGDDPVARGELDVIVDGALKARGLTESILAFSGRQMLAPRPMDLNGVVEEMEQIIRRTIPESIDVAFHLDDGETGVNADPSQMQQVLLNLVVNARDAMPSGGHLVISTKQVDLDEEFARDYATVEAGPHVQLSISDTGIGMDEETQARIFEPFFSTRQQGPGAGLGLATVYGIVKQSGGSIWVTSQQGFGTTFSIYLPRIDGISPNDRVAAPDEADSAPGGSEHVLLVADDPQVRRLTAQVLRRLGYGVTEVASPEAALELHDEIWPERGPHPVDVLVTDIIMPGMSGIELVRRLRLKREDLKVLLVSGHLDPTGLEDEVVVSESHLTKPFTPKELAQKMREALEGGEAAMAEAVLPSERQ